MIELVPAIDVIDGKCVRLTKGDYNNKTTYNDSPLDLAIRFESLGFRRLHMVDLEGAKSKHVVNIETLKKITDSTNLKVDFGGGIKTEDDIKLAFDNGASMVTVGSVAVTHRQLFMKWLDQFGAERIILGADVRNGKVSINGWKEDTTEDIVSFLKYYVGKGVKNVLCTDISKDGMLSGPAFSLYQSILASFPEINLIASGGVSNVDDIKKLEEKGVHSVVFGKAIYEDRINIETLVGELSCRTETNNK
ncbi:1-(5-phosphoribosyl)-5-[(5-phosphoribosylamino)methylideneamino]imidazole-4-carboxamide isomerase [uncultured Prevotella sp.]|uniref:1-(5-phosphoribosyl)-5-[(5- phosphoribosylamino)methylideneamino]imidazole-4- carboxamide isomerase n=1 Tax=uncultured Prevotella sp. TaxID=159272 RepID=UPI00260290FD|nr:1-(5-phosphoribosyl)-5-[(5-phosphoribosylamino)methylideneamino]imidazole-4-carboxamide isomerase [uncultured Prevotella sp.]